MTNTTGKKKIWCTKNMKKKLILILIEWNQRLRRISKTRRTWITICNSTLNFYWLLILLHLDDSKFRTECRPTTLHQLEHKINQVVKATTTRPMIRIEKI